MSQQQMNVINFIAGPGVGKSTIGALLYANLKRHNYNVEYVQEYAKMLVYQKDWDTLKNQYYVSQQQYKILESMKRCGVENVVTDAPLIQGLYYNMYYKDNVSNIEKTEEAIMKWYNEFNNINILLIRNDGNKYEDVGRYQNLKEAKEVDIQLKNLLEKHSIHYVEFLSDFNNVNGMIDYITSKINKEKN